MIARRASALSESSYICRVLSCEPQDHLDGYLIFFDPPNAGRDTRPTSVLNFPSPKDSPSACCWCSAAVHPKKSRVILSFSPSSVDLMSASLPVELLAVIISLCAKSDFPALCLASKTFHDITEPLLYHDVCISCRDVKTDTEARNMFERIVGLFEGLRNNGYRAAMVKRLEVMEL